MSEPTIHEVSKELTRLREQMNTHQAKYEDALDRFRADMEKTDTAFERRRTDMAKEDSALDRFRADMAKEDSAFERLWTDNGTAFERLRTDIAQREINRMRWLIGLWIGGVLVTIAVLGIFIRLAI